ncbi:MAG TPA: TetR/AcrR family transcriptional regulator [Streptosporangiaceae bacterium]
MTRLAASRRTQLTPDEIVAEALRQFDAGPAEPTIRSLAASLGVAPAAIYHHFSSQAAIFQKACELVWNEASVETLSVEPHPFHADPVDVLVAVGLGTRRAWMRHHRLSRYLTGSPEATEFTRNALGLLASVFERMGMAPAEVGAAFHAYATFMIGAVLFAAGNRTVNEQVFANRKTARTAFHAEPTPRAGSHSSAATRAAVDQMIDLSIVDPQRDEELYVFGLRRLVESLARGS